MAYKPDQRAHQPVDVDYQSLYDALYASCGKANGDRKKLLTTIAKNIGALLKIICDPDPPGCAGPIQPVPDTEVPALLLKIQQANAEKQQKLQAINGEIEALMQKMCDPDPPGCTP